jgi:hypothetical protein
MNHSLAEAVADGTITEQAAFCGLTPEDMVTLASRHPHAEVLVRYSSRLGDWRAVMLACDFPGNALGVGTLRDVRDVFAVRR